MWSLGVSSLVRVSVGHQFVTIATNATQPRQVKAAVCFKLHWFVCDSAFFCFALHWPLLLLFLYVSFVILQCTCFVTVWVFCWRCQAKSFAVFKNLPGLYYIFWRIDLKISFCNVSKNIASTKQSIYFLYTVKFKIWTFIEKFVIHITEEYHQICYCHLSRR